MAFAANRIVENRGGITVVENGTVLGELVLQIAGLMSEDSLVEVNDHLEAAKERAFEPVSYTHLDVYKRQAYDDGFEHFVHAHLLARLQIDLAAALGTGGLRGDDGCLLYTSPGTEMGRACGLRPAGCRRTALAAAVGKDCAAVISCRSHARE